MTTQPLMYANKMFADAAIASVSFQRSIGHARIVVDVRLQPHPAYASMSVGERPWEVRLGGWVAGTHAQNHIAELTPIIHVWARNDHPHGQTEQLYGTATFRQLELLHEQRGSSEAALQLTINLIATTFGSSGSSIGGRFQLPFNISASDWRQMLETCGYAKHCTIEIAVDGEGVRPPLRAAATSLRHALDHRAAGRWPEAVSACREVFDAIEGVFGTVEPPVAWAQFEQRTAREDLNLAERVRAMRMIMRVATHLAHHSAGTQFSREDATYLVDATCTAFKFYNERLR